MKFCQADGTPLVLDSAAAQQDDDPFKTQLGIPNQQPAEDFDPMKTMVAAPPPVDAPPPSPFNQPSQPRSSDLNAPSFGDLNSPQFGSTPLPSEPSAPRNESFGQSNQPTFKEPEAPFGSQQPFGNQQPFGQPAAEWAPPPAPAEWGNQGLGQNTPFSPPATQGQNKTLPIISLVTGILSILCCYISVLTGPAALITGYLGLNKIKQDPAQFGGRGLALAGMITGALGLVIFILYIIYIIAVVGLSAAYGG